MNTSVKERMISQKTAATRRDILYGAAAGALSQTVSLSFGAGDVHAQPENKPNILLIYSDQHRPDAMGCAGNPVIVTPHLDRLAREGTRFSQMWCQSPLCRPARASMITARYPHEHGIVTNLEKPFNPAWPTMMRNLQAAGYVTANIGKMHYSLPNAEDFADPNQPMDYDIRSEDAYIKSFGFDFVLQEAGLYEPALTGYGSTYTDYLHDHGLLEIFRKEVRSAWQQGTGRFKPYVSEIPIEHDHTSFLARQTIKWIENRDTSKPFFMTLAPFAPHLPFAGQRIWADYYAGKEMPGGPRDRAKAPNDVWAKWIESRYRVSQADNFSEERIGEIKRMYYAMVSLVDQKIGEIMNILEKRGELDNTWILYSADHGEMLGDHLMMEKSTFYKSAVGVPGLIRPPHGAPGRQLVETPTEVIDMTATILDIAGATPLASKGGFSLLPLMNGASVADARAYSEIGNKNGFMVAVTDGRFRLTVEWNSRTPCEFFDLDNDFDELVNLVNDPVHARRVTDMQTALIEPHMRQA